MTTRTKDRITQVRLTAAACFGHTHDVAWIETRLAKVGKKLLIEGDERVWTVAEVYGTREVSDLDWQYRTWREFADKLGG